MVQPKIPKSSKEIRMVLTKYLEGMKGYLPHERDRSWVQAEIHRYRDQMLMLEGRMSTRKATGITRKIDDLGRIVIPIELRRTLQVELDDALEIFHDEDNQMVVLQKYSPACCLCGENIDVKMFRGKRVCEICIEDLIHEREVERS